MYFSSINKDFYFIFAFEKFQLKSLSILTCKLNFTYQITDISILHISYNLSFTYQLQNTQQSINTPIV